MVWSSLPNELRTSENYGQFRRLIRRWDAPCADAQSENRSHCPHVTAVHLLLLLTKFYFLI